MNEVIIIGGGPAGSVMGSFLSRAGIKNIILESAIHPRDHVGESLVASTTRILDEIGFIPTMEKENFVHKFGAAWHDFTGREFPMRFSEYPLPDIKQPYTYHVDRAKFDALLLKHAEMSGSEVYQGVHVKQVLFDESGKACGVRAKFAGKEIDLESKMVVDASGRNTILARQLGLKKKDPIFNQYAVYSWFEGVDRSENEATTDFIHIYFLPVQRGWAWQIPITETITSIGVVAEREMFAESKNSLEGYFNKYIQSNKRLEAAMKNAVRVGEFKTEGDYSYSMDRFVGDGWVLIGDAARFVDPIFSSGVSIAQYSAKFASEVIIKAFETGDFSTAAFMPYEKKIRGGVNVWYEFIRLYYKLLPLFTHFVQSKEHRFEIIRLLQGEVFDRTEVPVLDAMRDYIRKVETTENHLFKSQLSDVPIDPIPAYAVAPDKAPGLTAD